MVTVAIPYAMSGDISTHEVVVSTYGLLLIKVSAAHQTDYWRPSEVSLTESAAPSFGRLNLVISHCDDYYAICATGSGSSSTEIPLKTVKEYVIKTRIWHEMTSTDGRQMALYLSVGESLTKFTTILTSVLKILGKFNRLKAPMDLISGEELNERAQRIVLLRTLSIDEVGLSQQQQQSSVQLRQSSEKPNHDNNQRRRPYSNYEQSQTFGSPKLPQIIAAECERRDSNDDEETEYTYAYATAGPQRSRNIATMFPVEIPPDIPPRTNRGDQPPPRSPVRRPQPAYDRSTPSPKVSLDQSPSSSVGSWNCGRCDLHNVATSFRCEQCLSVRPDAWQCPSIAKCKRRLNPVEQKACPDCKAWKCQACTSINFRSSICCTVCNHRH